MGLYAAIDTADEMMSTEESESYPSDDESDSSFCECKSESEEVVEVSLSCISVSESPAGEFDAPRLRSSKTPRPRFCPPVGDAG